MNARRMAIGSAGVLCGVMLTACGSSDELPAVGNPENVVIEEETSTANDSSSADESQDDLMVEVTTTDLPDYWPADFPVPDGAVIDNVIESGDSVTVTWILPGGSVAGITQDFSNALFDAGFEYGQSEGSDEVGQGRFNNEENEVDFTITPIGEGQIQLYLVYGPFTQ